MLAGDEVVKGSVFRKLKLTAEKVLKRKVVEDRVTGFTPGSRLPLLAFKAK